jgi:hypothetical protein
MGFDTFAAIKIHIMERALEDSEETDGDFSTLAEDAIVQSHRDFAMRWPILEWRKDPPGAFLTVDDITTTTITAAIGEAVTATLSTAPSDSIQGRKIQPTGEEWYARVTSHAAGSTSCVLDVVQSTLAADACVIFQDEYNLATDIGVLVDGLWYPNGHFVPLKSEEVIQEAFQTPQGDGFPSAFARIGRRKILLSHYPTSRKRVEYSYYRFPDDPSGTSELELPKHWRIALAEMSFALLLGMKFDRREGDARNRAEKLTEEAIKYERQRLSSLQTIAPSRYVGAYGS